MTTTFTYTSNDTNALDHEVRFRYNLGRIEINHGCTFESMHVPFHCQETLQKATQDKVKSVLSFLIGIKYPWKSCELTEKELKLRYGTDVYLTPLLQAMGDKTFSVFVEVVDGNPEMSVSISL